MRKVISVTRIHTISVPLKQTQFLIQSQPDISTITNTSMWWCKIQQAKTSSQNHQKITMKCKFYDNMKWQLISLYILYTNIYVACRIFAGSNDYPPNRNVNIRQNKYAWQKHCAVVLCTMAVQASYIYRLTDYDCVTTDRYYIAQHECQCCSSETTRMLHNSILCRAHKPGPHFTFYLSNKMIHIAYNFVENNLPMFVAGAHTQLGSHCTLLHIRYTCCGISWLFSIFFSCSNMMLMLLRTPHELL